MEMKFVKQNDRTWLCKMLYKDYSELVFKTFPTEDMRNLFPTNDIEEVVNTILVKLVGYRFHTEQNAYPDTNFVMIRVLVYDCDVLEEAKKEWVKCIEVSLGKVTDKDGDVLLCNIMPRDVLK